MEHTTIAVDLAKSVFQVAVSHRPGHVDHERRMSRSRFVQYLAQQPPALVLLEACGSAHYWARELQRFGHTVRLLPADDVHRYVRRNKTDRTDTKALLEAERNEEIHAVPVKTVDQQAVASLHRLRSTWLATRTARLNTLRGLLREFGVTIPVGAQHVVAHVRAVLAADATPVPAVIGATLTETCEEVRRLETNIRAVQRQLAALAPQMPDVTVLLTVPGVGLLTATALVALVGDIHRFPSAREFASYLGLTPKEDSSGPRRRLGAISKQGACISACCWSTARDRCCATRRPRRSRTRCSAGRSALNSVADTTSRPLPLPTSWRESRGRSGSSTARSSPIRMNRQDLRRSDQEDCTELSS